MGFWIFIFLKLLLYISVIWIEYETWYAQVMLTTKYVLALILLYPFSLEEENLEWYAFLRRKKLIWTEFSVSIDRLNYILVLVDGGVE